MCGLLMDAGWHLSIYRRSWRGFGRSPLRQLGLGTWQADINAASAHACCGWALIAALSTISCYQNVDVPSSCQTPYMSIKRQHPHSGKQTKSRATTFTHRDSGQHSWRPNESSCLAQATWLHSRPAVAAVKLHGLWLNQLLARELNQPH